MYHFLKFDVFTKLSVIRKPKFSNILPHRKRFAKLVWKQYGNLDSQAFFSWVPVNLRKINNLLLAK